MHPLPENRCPPASLTYNPCTYILNRPENQISLTCLAKKLLFLKDLRDKKSKLPPAPPQPARFSQNRPKLANYPAVATNTSLPYKQMPPTVSRHTRTPLTHRQLTPLATGTHRSTSPSHPPIGVTTHQSSTDTDLNERHLPLKHTPKSTGTTGSCSHATHLFATLPIVLLN